MTEEIRLVLYLLTCIVILIGIGHQLNRIYLAAFDRSVEVKIKTSLEKYCHASTANFKEVDVIRGYLLMDPNKNGILKEARRLVIRVTQDFTESEKKIIEKYLYSGTVEERHEYLVKVICS